MPAGRPLKPAAERARTIGVVTGTAADRARLHRQARSSGHRSVSGYLRSLLGWDRPRSE